MMTYRLSFTPVKISERLKKYTKLMNRTPVSQQRNKANTPAKTVL